MTYVHPKFLFYIKRVVDGDPKADGPPDPLAHIPV